ncbi:MAG: hypothetical protein LBT94_08180 [Prevotellaceae bacterium]|jgi:hypothetical protein|nr:hypothetical protein [Prevotellaceae bacterium]
MNTITNSQEIKKKSPLLSLIFGLSLILGLFFLGVLFNQCVDNVESESVSAIRKGYAAKLEAEVEYQKAEAEYKRAEAELKKLEVEIEKLTLEGEKEKLKTTLRQQEAALAQADSALVAAKKALALAEAQALADNPKLTQYQMLYNQLFSTSIGYYAQKSSLLGDKIEAKNAILTLRYGVNADHLAWLVSDSIKAGEELKNAKDLLAKYKALDGLTVEELQAKVDDAKLDWDKAKLEAAQKNGAYTTAQQKYSEESAKLAAEKSKLSNLEDKIAYSGVSLLIPDTLRYLNYYLSTTFTGDIVSQQYYVTKTGGYQTIVSYATGRLNYLKSGYISTQQLTGFDNVSYQTPSYDYPTRKWLEEQISSATDADVKARCQTVLGWVNSTITYYNGLVSKYKGLADATSKEISAQIAVVNAQAEKAQAAQVESSAASAAYTAANSHATNLATIYNTLNNASGALATIKGNIETLEGKINPSSYNSLITKVENANSALATYRVQGSGYTVIAAAIAEKEAELATIEAKITAVETIIAEIEAKMQTLLPE